MNDLNKSFQSLELGIQIGHLQFDDGGTIGPGLRRPFLKKRDGVGAADGESRRWRHDFGKDGRQPFGLQAGNHFIKGDKAIDVPRDEAKRGEFLFGLLFGSDRRSEKEPCK